MRTSWPSSTNTQAAPVSWQSGTSFSMPISRFCRMESSVAWATGQGSVSLACLSAHTTSSCRLQLALMDRSRTASAIWEAWMTFIARP